MIPLGVLASAYVAPAGSSWTPADLTGLELWFDASDASTITASDGLISQWDDKSGNARHLAQATEASRPSTGTRTINGLNTIDHDGSGKRLETSWTVPKETWSWLVVAQVDSKTSWNLLSLGWNDVYLARGSSGGTGVPHNRFNNTGIVPVVKINGSEVTTTGALHTAMGTSAAIVSTSPANPTVTGQIFVTSDSAGTYAIDGAIGEIIAADVLSSGDMASAMSYLAAKWGITL